MPASVIVTPNPVPVGETFKIEGTGFALENSVSVIVDGDEVGIASTRPSPEGGVADYYYAIDKPGAFEVELHQSQGKGKSALAASFDVEVVTGWPEPAPAAPAPPAAKKGK